MSASEPVHWAGLLQGIVDDLAHERGQGHVATYIPPLANVDPNKLGIALALPSGQVFFAGDAAERFSIQSISKLFTLTLALPLDSEGLWKRVGREPSGSRFNSLVQLESERGVPRNPFINAGALVVTDVILDHLDDAKLTVLDLVRRLSGSNDITYDLAVAQGEQATGDRNKAMAWFIRSFGNLRNSPDAVLDAYFHHCALSMSCIELAKAGVFLANGGLDAQGRRVMSLQQSKYVNALMLTCGTYDAAGEFAYRVGLAAKSGVGGGILAVLPGRFSVCVWSPGLGPTGNSLLGMKALTLLTERSGSSMF